MTRGENGLLTLVLHGVTAVAALKPACTSSATRPCVPVLHGVTAVAALKLWFFGRRRLSQGGVLHGVTAVAALKRLLRRPPRRRPGCSPRRHCRGRIEACIWTTGPTATLSVLHGVTAVAA